MAAISSFSGSVSAHSVWCVCVCVCALTGGGELERTEPVVHCARMCDTSAIKEHFII